MYSIFGSKSTKVKYLEEGEPPPKKQITEGNILIKNLIEKQSRTKTTLSEHIIQLNQQQKFTQSDQFVDIAGQVCGNSTLKDFQTTINNVDELNKLKSKGLDDRDIEIYKDYLKLDSQFWDKYKDVNKDILKQRLREIIHTVDYVHSTIKFTNTNKSNPLDQLANLEKDFTNSNTNYSKCDIKKIRKKARSLGNKINDMNVTVTNSQDCKDVYELNRTTLWDVKEKPAEKECVNMINKNQKHPTCHSQTLYTIRNGQIIKLNTNDEHENKIKLTLAEIKKIPKFALYEAGKPSKILFLKNLGKKVNEKSFETFLGNFHTGSYTVRIMNGKMKGQAFITFQDEVQAIQGLKALNGVFIDGRPIIAQFGKEQECRSF